MRRDRRKERKPCVLEKAEGRGYALRKDTRQKSANEFFDTNRKVKKQEEARISAWELRSKERFPKERVDVQKESQRVAELAWLSTVTNIRFAK